MGVAFYATAFAVDPGFTENKLFNFRNGAPGTIRTSDPQIRSLMLYPAELRARFSQRARTLRSVMAAAKPVCRSRKRAIATGSEPAWQGLGQTEISVNRLLRPCPFVTNA